MHAFIEDYLGQIAALCSEISVDDIQDVIRELAELRVIRGRLFLLGVGGSAAMCSHAVGDIRKFTGIESYCATDNIAELTAVTNDSGWEETFSSWLASCFFSFKDALLIFSVGGGSKERNISANICKAARYAKSKHGRVIGIVGRDGGFTAEIANACVVIPDRDKNLTTPFVESMHAVLLHLIVSHPSLKITEAKWESTK